MSLTKAKPKKENRMRITLSTSRFNAAPMHSFLKRIHGIAKKAREKTETEKRILRVRWSMENDVSLSGLLLAKEARINELDSERGSSIFHQRQAEIRAAQAKSA